MEIAWSKIINFVIVFAVVLIVGFLLLPLYKDQAMAAYNTGCSLVPFVCTPDVTGNYYIRDFQVVQGLGRQVTVKWMLLKDDTIDAKLYMQNVCDEKQTNGLIPTKCEAQQEILLAPTRIKDGYEMAVTIPDFEARTFNITVINNRAKIMLESKAVLFNPTIYNKDYQDSVNDFADLNEVKIPKLISGSGSSVDVPQYRLHPDLVVVGFNKEDTHGECGDPIYAPDECSGKTCLCLCLARESGYCKQSSRICYATGADYLLGQSKDQHPFEGKEMPALTVMDQNVYYLALYGDCKSLGFLSGPWSPDWASYEKDLVVEKATVDKLGETYVKASSATPHAKSSDVTIRPLTLLEMRFLKSPEQGTRTVTPESLPDANQMMLRLWSEKEKEREEHYCLADGLCIEGVTVVAPLWADKSRGVEEAKIIRKRISEKVSVWQIPVCSGTSFGRCTGITPISVSQDIATELDKRLSLQCSAAPADLRAKARACTELGTVTPPTSNDALYETPKTIVYHDDTGNLDYTCTVPSYKEFKLIGKKDTVNGITYETVIASADVTYDEKTMAFKVADKGKTYWFIFSYKLGEEVTLAEGSPLEKELEARLQEKIQADTKAADQAQPPQVQKPAEPAGSSQSTPVTITVADQCNYVVPGYDQMAIGPQDVTSMDGLTTYKTEAHIALDNNGGPIAYRITNGNDVLWLINPAVPDCMWAVPNTAAWKELEARYSKQLETQAAKG